jgi:hypothetical protein
LDTPEEQMFLFKSKGKKKAKVPAQKQAAGHQWLTPVILATQKAEIRRTVVQSQSRQIM